MIKHSYSIPQQQKKLDSLEIALNLYRIWYRVAEQNRLRLSLLYPADNNFSTME